MDCYWVWSVMAFNFFPPLAFHRDSGSFGDRLKARTEEKKAEIKTKEEEEKKRLADLEKKAKTDAALRAWAGEGSF